MNTVFIELVGTLAACLTTAAFFPQAIKTIRTRETTGLSIGMYMLLVTGVAMWLLYGFMIGNWPLMVANSVVIVPQVAILILLLQRHWRPK